MDETMFTNQMINSMIKRKLLLLLLCYMGTFLFPLSTFAESGYVGDEFSLSRPSLPYNATKTRHVTWSGLNSDGLSGYETSMGAKVRITSFFEGSRTVTCDVEYEWISGDRTLTSHVNKSYSIHCNAVTINVSNTNMTMKVGQKQTISYYLSPSKNATLTFTSSNSSVASVSSFGEVTAVGKGSATITIKQNMGYDAKCYVTVTEPVPATSISLPSEATVDVYSTKMLYPTLQPSDANPTLTWESANTSIASVDQNGKVTGKNPGTTTITVTTDNNLSASCTLTVKDIDRTPQQFDIDDVFSQKTVYVGDTWQVPYTVTPSYARYTLRWTSSDESIATVDRDDNVTAKKQGTTRITGSIDGTSLTDYCDVTVKAIPNVLTIWFANGQRSDIKLSEHINVTFEADKFAVKSATVDVEYDAINVLKFTLENDGLEDTGIKTAETDKSANGIMNFDGNAIRLSGFTPGSIVQLFTVDGQYVDSYRIGQDGSLIISLDGLKRGVHIVKTESITYKIIKK